MRKATPYFLKKLRVSGARARSSTTGSNNPLRRYFPLGDSACGSSSLLAVRAIVTAIVAAQLSKSRAYFHPKQINEEFPYGDGGTDKYVASPTCFLVGQCLLSLVF